MFMCWSSSNDPGPRPAHEASKKKEEKNRKYHISELCRARNAPPMRQGDLRYHGRVQIGGCGGVQDPQQQDQPAAERTKGYSQPLCWLSLLGMPEEGPHWAYKTSVEKQMKGKWSKPANISIVSSAGGLQPLPPFIPLRCIHFHPLRDLGCSKGMATESGVVQSAGRDM